MSRPDPRTVCHGCGRSFDRRQREYVAQGPMVRAAVWRELGGRDGEWLCVGCMDQRALDRLGRALELDDLRLCPWNWEGRPSWWDVFTNG